MLDSPSLTKHLPVDHVRRHVAIHKLSILQADFDKAAEEAKTLPYSVTNDDKLKLYGLFKQATVGDVEGCKSLRKTVPMNKV